MNELQTSLLGNSCQPRSQHEPRYDWTVVAAWLDSNVTGSKLQLLYCAVISDAGMPAVYNFFDLLFMPLGWIDPNFQPT